METRKLSTEISSLAAKEETTEGLLSFSAGDKSHLKSFSRAREVTASQEEIKLTSLRCSSSKLQDVSELKGVKRKSLDTLEQSTFEIKHYRKNGVTGERFAEEVDRSGEKRLSDDGSSRRRDGENGNGGYNSRSEKRLKLKSSATNGTENSQSHEESGIKDDGEGIDSSTDAEKGQTRVKNGKSSRPSIEEKEGKVRAFVNDDVQQYAWVSGYWKGTNHHGYLGGADFNRSRMTKSRREGGRQQRTKGQPSIKGTREDVRHSTRPVCKGRKPKSIREGTFVRDDSHWRRGNTESRSVENSRTRRDVPTKRSRGEVDWMTEHDVKHSARGRKVDFEDQDLSGGDKRRPGEKLDRFRPRELEEESSFEGLRDKKVINEEDRKHGDSRQHHCKESRPNWEPANGNKSHQHGGEDGFMKSRAGRRNFRYHRLAKTNDKSRSRRKRYFTGNAEYQGHSVAKIHKQNSRGLVSGFNENHRQFDQDEQRKSHRSDRRLVHDSSWPRNERRIGNDGIKERNVRQTTEDESGPDSVMQNSEDQKSGEEKVDHSSRGMRGTDQPKSKDIEVDRHELDQKPGTENGHQSSRGTKCTDQPERIDTKVTSHEVDQKPSKENVERSPRGANRIDQAGSTDIKVARQGMDQKSGKENVDISSRGTRSTDQAGTEDVEVARHEEDQMSSEENVDHCSGLTRTTRGTDQPESIDIKMHRLQVGQKPGKENVQDSKRETRGTDQSSSIGSKVARHEVDQKSGKENGEHSSGGARGTDQAGSVDIKVARLSLDQKSSKEYVDHSSGSIRGTGQPGRVAIKADRLQLRQKPGKENVDDSTRGTRGTDQASSLCSKVARHGVAQKLGKEIGDHSSGGTRGTDQAGSIDIKVAKLSLDQKSGKEYADHSSGGTRGTGQPGLVAIKAPGLEADQKSFEENVDHYSRGTRGTDQPNSIDIKSAKVDQKSGKENVDHSSSGGKRGTDPPGSVESNFGGKEVGQMFTKETVDRYPRGTRTDQAGSRGTKVAFQINKAGGGSRRTNSGKAVGPSQLDEHDVDGITDRNGGKGENALTEAKLLDLRSQKNSTGDDMSNSERSADTKSLVQEAAGGATEANHETSAASFDTSHQSKGNPSISEKRKRKDRDDLPEGGEKFTVTNANERESVLIQEGGRPKSLLEKNNKDVRNDGTARRKPSRPESDAQNTTRTDNRAHRKSDEVLQSKRAKFSRRKIESTDESVLRRQGRKGVKVDRYHKYDVSSHKEHRHHKKGRGRSHSLSPNKHKHFLSRNKHGKSTSPGRYISRSSDWEKFERARERSQRTLAAYDSRYRRFGGGTSGLGGYSPRRRRSQAAIKTPSPPPRSPDKRKEKAWDSAPPGLDSTMIAAISAAHQAAMQHALAQLATLSPLVPHNILNPPPAVRPSFAHRLTTVPSLLPSLLPQISPAVTAVTLTQATRPLRRLYVGNVPSTVSDGELLEFMNAAMLSSNANHLPGTKPCINCSVNLEKNHAFAEFITPEDATAALAFDGVILHGTTLKIRRPKDYVQPSNGGSESVLAVPDMVSSIVADSPHKVFVGGIPSSLTADKVKEIAAAFGQLKAYRWEVDSKKQPPQAYAFLEYMDPAATMKACAGLNGMKLGTSSLTVVQATPDADAKTASINAPFYGIPEHAKTLLEPPSCVLELHNLVPAGEIPNMSKEEIEELIEDVRLECIRFGSVKSVHMVHQLWSHPDLETEDTPSLGKIKGLAPDSIRGETLDSTIVRSAEECVGKDDTQVDLTGARTETVAEMSSGPARLQCSISRDADEKQVAFADGFSSGNICERNAKSSEEESGHSSKSSGVDMENTSPRLVVGELCSQCQASTSGKEETNQSDGNELMIHTKDEDTGGGLGLVGGSGQEVDASMKEWEASHLGNVYVEFSCEDSACQAAHALHGRLFDGHKVAVSYFPLTLYQQRFQKSRGPRSFQKKEPPAIPVQAS